MAPPERDLWMTGVHQRYPASTGVDIRPDGLDFFRLRWELADLASFGSWLRRTAPSHAPDTERAGTGRWRSALACRREAGAHMVPPGSTLRSSGLRR